MLLTIVVYIYTVIAFNFFRKFYVSEEEENEVDQKCHDMLTCFVFHLYKGVRAGGKNYVFHIGTLWLMRFCVRNFTNT